MLHRRRLLSALGALALCPLCARRGLAASGWSWEGDTGPEHWGSLPGYATCSAGSQQSPIDITGAIKANLPPLHISWQKASATIYNPGYTIQVNMPPGSKLSAGSTSYDLLQFHFHAPSEHTVDGKRAAMEIHFVHQNTAGSGVAADVEDPPVRPWLAVIGVFIQPGGSNAAFARVAQAMPQQAGERAPISVDPNGMLPRSLGYWRYEGSLTTPPCSETVDWIVLREPIKVAAADIERFSKLYPNSARPLLPRNRRFVLLAN